MKTLDSHQENIPIAVIGLNHKTANVDIREKATFSEDQQTSLIQQISKRFNTRGALVLSTCNRTEIYLCGRKAIKYISDLCTFLDKTKEENIFSDKEITYFYTGRKAIHHFFLVITSLDSQIIGEPQIIGQVKNAYEKSHQLKHTDVLLNKMYNFGMQVEKQVRTNTYLGDGAVSVSFAGVELARKIFGNLQNSTVLLIGAGETAELVALNFVDRQVSKILVANRTLKNARRIASKVNGEALKMEDLSQAIDLSDIIITASSSEEFI
jgi:glutamyl-tRNA reductase